MIPIARGRFEVADLVAIIAGVSSLGVSLYGAPITVENAQDAPISFLWLLFVVAGVMAVGSVFLAQRSRGPARIMLALAGALVLLAALIPGGDWAVLRIVHVVIGLAMLGAATSIGRVVETP